MKRDKSILAERFAKIRWKVHKPTKAHLDKSKYDRKAEQAEAEQEIEEGFENGD
jgi:hypothetical protein